MILTRQFTSSLAVRDGGDGRTLHGPLLPWGVEARVVDRGRLVVETSPAAPWSAPIPPSCR